jgi:Ca2+-binding RTX toxin-like protein
MAQVVDEFDNVGRQLDGVAGEANTLIGNGGNDTLIGADLVDLFYGGSGDDLITGGARADRVVFEHDFTNTQSFGSDRWLDFNAGQIDKVDVSALGQGGGSGGSVGIGELDTLRAMMATVFYSGGSDVQITWGSSRLTLVGAQSSDLGSSHFVFNTVAVADVFVFGTGHQIIALSYGDDFVDGGSGNDSLFGEQNNDTVLGGNGSDLLFGGSGRDVIWGDAGIDTLYGGLGADTLVSGGGSDLFFGGDGADLVQMRHGALSGTTNEGGRWTDFALVQGDRIDVSHLGGSDSSTFAVGVGEIDTILAMDAALAGGGVSIVWGGSRLDLPTVSTLTAAMFRFSTDTQADTISLNATGNLIAVAGGSDTVAGNAGNDTIFGEQGDDSLLGGSLNDMLYGGSGHDVLRSGTGDDTLYGGAGNDVMYGGDGGTSTNLDLLLGGLGDDIYYVPVYGMGISGSYYGADVSEAANAGMDTYIIDAPLTPLGLFVAPVALPENVEIGIATGESIWMNGNALDNRMTASSRGKSTLDGGVGNDSLYGQDFRDDLSGGEGDDVLYGQAGNDALYGGVGRDLVFGGTGDDSFYAGSTVANSDTAQGGAGNDTAYLFSASGDVEITLAGSSFASVFVNGTRYDRIREFENIVSGSGDDRLIGDALGNLLDGNEGADTLTGGGGADIFVFDWNARRGVDTVTDFEVGSDLIHLSKTVFPAIGAALLAGEFRVGPAALDGNDFVIYNPTNGRLMYDADGNGSGARVVFAQLEANLSLTSFDFLMIN